MTQTVPCGLYRLSEPRDERGRLTSVACGGVCRIESVGETLTYYRCERCGLSTSRRTDGRPMRNWDGLLRDGTPYEGSAVHENDWRL